MRWGRKRTHEENLTDRKSFSLSYLLSFSWLSKPRNNTSPKCPSSKLKCASKNPIPDTIRHVSTDQTIAPRRRSVGDADRPLPWCHRRHYSVGGDHVPTTSSLTLSHIIPFTIIPNQKQSIPPMSGLYQSVPDPGLHPRKIKRRRRKLKNRLIVAASGDTHRKSFSGRIRSRRYSRARARSPQQGRKDLENFAVVKKSSEPERDFKESMVEMILEKRIGRPEELESLLACYLALNSDEHHDVIVKVFRQVWFEINPDRFACQRLIV